jgi:hypothetical protein
LLYLLPPGHSWFPPLLPSVDGGIDDNGILTDYTVALQLYAIVPKENIKIKGSKQNINNRENVFPGGKQPPVSAPPPGSGWAGA